MNRSKSASLRSKSRRRPSGSVRPGGGAFVFSPFFQDLPAECLVALEGAATQGQFAQGHVFFRAAEKGQMLYLLERGSVQTFRMLAQKKLVVADLGAGSVFGEMGVVGQRVYHCNAQATSASRVWMIPLERVDEMVEAWPILTRKFLDLVSQRFFDTLMELEATSFRDLIPRLAGLLLKRAEGDRVRNLTHQELAEYLRVYRESTTAALGELRKAGIIEVGRKEIRILDRARLERAGRE